jgi:H+/Na+-translocating ferredoxin:NAD+ oxidoreductase subunit C
VQYFNKSVVVLQTFARGGVHPPENNLTANCRIRALEIPRSVVLPLSQHLGAPAKPVVSKGDVVKTGQLIAAGDGFVSSPVHASVSGKISRIEETVDMSGYKRPAIFIDTEGDVWEESIDRSSALATNISLSGQDMIKKISEMGIVGLGGATFPTQVKLSVPRGKKAEYLVINGVECEPYLTSDHALMLEKGEEIMVGIQILKKALNVDKAIIGIENNKTDAIRNLRMLAQKYPGTAVSVLKVKYPQGGEKQLIKALLNREVPSGGLPVDIGVVAFNVGTAFAVYEAVQKNKPLIERIVTITGKSLKQPGNFRVRIGTPVAALIEATGGMPEDTGKIIAGGPMMGKALANADVPVVKGSSGFVLLPEKESLRGKIEPCVRCAKCVAACPMGLEPYLLMALSQKNLFERLEDEKVMDCMECGCCSYACPADRPLLDYIRLGKAQVGKIIRSRKKPA